MSWYVARSLDVLRDEINDSAPNRSKASDGSIGDAAHSSRTSDHNPCSCHSCVCARDITHDPEGGFDSYFFAEWLRRRCQSGQEKRVKYIISNSKIASGTSNNWNWRSYSGANPHNKHVHISAAHGPAFFDNTMPWDWLEKVQPPTTPPSTEEDDDMAKQLLIQIADGPYSGGLAVATPELSRMMWLSSGSDYTALAGTGSYDAVSLSWATVERIPGVEQVDVVNTGE